jgi:hypothetical protein
MKTKTRVRAGGRQINHNETVVRDSSKRPGLKVKSRVQAGLSGTNHNETLVRDTRGKR